MDPKAPRKAPEKKTRIDEAVDDLIRHLAEEAGVPEEEAFRAVEEGRTVEPRRRPERRRARRALALLVLAGVALLLALWFVHGGFAGR